MNPNYNKDLVAIIIILMSIIFLLSYCSFNRTNKKESYVYFDTIPVCEECDEFYESYLEDSIENNFIKYYKDSIDFKKSTIN